MELIVNNVKVHYQERGAGKTIYFLHGLGLDSESMIQTYDAFLSDKNIRRVYVDLPGMGESEVNHDLNSSDDILRILQKFIIADSGDETISLCGHSYGGYLCLGLAHKLKTKVNSLFLTCPVLVANLANRKIGVHKNIFQGKVSVESYESYYEDFLSMNVLINNDTWEKYQKAIIPGLTKFNSDFWSDLQSNHYENYSFSFEDELVSSSTPYKGMMLLGKNDQIVGYQDQLSLLNDSNDLEVTILNDAGHNLFIDISEDIHFYLNRFVQFL